MEQQGKVIAVLQPREGTSKTGTPWKSQEYVIETDGQYPKKICFEVFGEDKISQYTQALQVGNLVKVSFDIDAREWNGRWFNSIRAWKVDMVVQQARPTSAFDAYAQQQMLAQAPQAIQQVVTGEPQKDDLPF